MHVRDCHCPKIGYNKSVQYSWDPKKAASNLKNHGVSFEEAATVLENPLTEFAPELDSTEPRVRAIGVSRQSRLLFVVALEITDDEMRIISARRANRAERRGYGNS